MTPTYTLFIFAFCSPCWPHFCEYDGNILGTMEGIGKREGETLAIEGMKKDGFLFLPYQKKVFILSISGFPAQYGDLFLTLVILFHQCIYHPAPLSTTKRVECEAL
jgi:hypothetical protein